MLLLISNESNLGPIVPRFRYITAFERSNQLFQHPAPILAQISGVPLGVGLDHQVGVAKSEHPEITNG